MSSSSTSLSSVNTVFSYSGPPPPSLQRTESSNSVNLMANASGENKVQQYIPKPIMSHHTSLHPPMFMSPGIRNQPNNHTCMYFIDARTVLIFLYLFYICIYVHTQIIQNYSIMSIQMINLWCLIFINIIKALETFIRQILLQSLRNLIKW